MEGLLALTRAPRASADIVGTLERLETILGAVARVAGGEIAIEVPDDALAISTGADAGAVRAVLAAVLLEGACDGRRLRCTVLGGETTRLHVRDVGGGAFALPERVAVTASEAGIRVVPAADELILAFPPVAEAREEA